MIYKNLESIYERYDSFLVDVYGVIYSGSGFYDGVLDVLEKIKKSGRKIVILSNTTFVKEVCQEKYDAMGLTSGVHYDEFVSSGEAFKRMVSQYMKDAKSYFQIFQKNLAIFKDSSLAEAESIEDADFIYVGYLAEPYVVDNLKTKQGTRATMEDVATMDCRDIEGLEKIAETLNTCLKHNKPLVVANPDIFALEAVEENGVAKKKAILCQGAVGGFYEKMGGKALYFGKPYPAIYDFAKRFLAGCEKTAMIGDTVWTDILGGNMAGIDTILTLTGISGEFLKFMDNRLSTEEKINALLNEISLKTTPETLRDFSRRPTHIIESVA
ncbi:MAG: TIGR01459 family HAD-type hydrolase [Holosporales bacterium]|jgi:HAD superfamily hydrolase (TIGR01459 family)|nr:TIGR01459 family HAD-type hydrolase [Holosporales bacterium]